MKLMEVGDLELPNKDDFTAFHYAAALGQTEITKAMRERNKNQNIPCDNGLLPVTMATLFGIKLWYHTFLRLQVLM